MTYRIGLGGIHIESSTFTSYRSGRKDFHDRAGAALLDRYPWREKYAERAQLLPLIHSAALPGGPVDPVFFETWRQDFFARLDQLLEAGPLDGFLLDIHGAMSVAGLDDAEGLLAQQLRDRLGPTTLISASMDLHGNVSDALFQACDLLRCYRTAPHIDTVASREAAFVHLLDLLDRAPTTLYKGKVDLPLLLPGEQTSTETEPGKHLYQNLARLNDQPGLLDVSLWMGFPWADEDRCHAVGVVTGWEALAVQTALHRLGDSVREALPDFTFVGPTASLADAIDQALSAPAKPFFLSDTGDNPGAGGSNDTNLVLQAFLDRQRQGLLHKKVLLASIVDPTALALLSRHAVGDQVRLSLGGSIDPLYGRPLSIKGQIQSLFTDPYGGPSVRLRNGNIDFIVTKQRTQFASWPAFQAAGLSHFSDYDILVVKIGYLEPDLAKAAKGWVMALTPGAVDQNLTSLPYQHRRRPLYPFERNIQPTDLHYQLTQRAVE